MALCFALCVAQTQGFSGSVLAVGEDDSTAARSSGKRQLAMRMWMEHPKVLKHLWAVP